MAHDPRSPRALKTKTPKDDESDKLSALPDEILCHILSFLPSETAAATSVLSTRWKDLFTSLPVIDLTISKNWDAKIGEERRRDLCNFQKFLSRLIFLRNKAPIRKFQLNVSPPLVEDLRPGIYWLISKVLSRQVQEVDICVPGDRDSTGLLLYPPEIFTCATLTSLTMTMKSSFNFNPPDSVSLPNLKVLRLNEFALTDQDSFARVIQACPLLEDLGLRWRFWKFEFMDLRISAPLLKRLALSCYFGQYSLMVESDNLEYLDCNVYGVHKLVINAPYLKYFKCQGPPVRVEFVQDVRNILNATVAFKYRKEEFESTLVLYHRQNLKSLEAFELVNGLQYAKSLRFQSGMKILYYAGEFLPTFVNLSSLALDDSIYSYHYSSWWLNLIARLLENAPNLEALDIVSSVFDHNFGVEQLGIFLRTAFPARPIRHLKELKIILGHDQEFGFKLAEYFLEIGKSLKKMTIRGSIKGWESSPEVYNRISSFKKSSEHCRIAFEP
ncbi:F-box protein At4g22280 [Coffea arabica]|uniref:F-box protein At4g22280 n=1 Tax=Coffea arabica TaxID=13443 RepID=A0A6P6SDN1_COFAR|nr:F-box protein At4g22280-like [Coffea arabica]